MKRYLLLGIITVLISCSFVAQNPNDTAVHPPGTYEIGAVLPLTGNSAHLGEAMAKGMQLGIQHVNANGGVNGKELKLHIQDGKLKGKHSVQAAQHLLQNENVDALSVLFAPPAKAIAPLAEQSRVPMVYEAFSHSTAKNHTYSFKANFNPLKGCKQMLQHAKANNEYDQLGVMMANAEWSKLCIKAIKQVEPDVKTYLYQFGEKDYRTLITKAKNDGVDVLVTIPVFAPINVFQQVSELAPNMTVYCATATECIYPKVKQNVPNTVLKGSLGADFIPANLSQTEFAKAYNNRYGNATNVQLGYAAFGYEQIMYLAQAMQQCQPGDGQCVKNALHNVQDYKSVLNTDGFKNGILQTENAVFRYNDTWTSVRNS